MRGNFEDQGRLFSYISPERRVPASLGKDSRKLYSARDVPRLRPNNVCPRCCKYFMAFVQSVS